MRRAETEDRDRPLLGAPEGRVGRAASLLAEREAAYARAELVVDAGREPEAIAAEIVKRLTEGVPERVPEEEPEEHER